MKSSEIYFFPLLKRRVWAGTTKRKARRNDWTGLAGLIPLNARCHSNFLLSYMAHSFRAKIYQLGINWCIDVPARITRHMTPEKGYIRIKGIINGYHFTTTLVPVKNGPYRLFVNALMMKGGSTAVGKTARFEIEQDFRKKEVMEYAMHPLLQQQL